MADDVHEPLDDSMLIGGVFAEGERDIGPSFLAPASSHRLWALASSTALLLCRLVGIYDREVKYTRKG